MRELLLKLMNISDADQLHHLNLNCLQELPFIHLYSKDRQGKYIGSSNSQARNIGYKNGQDLFGLTDNDLCVADDAAIIRRNDERVMMQQTPIFYTENVTTLNGDKFNGMSYKFPLRSRSKKTIGIIGASLLTEMNGKYLLDMKLAMCSNKQERKETERLTTREIDCLYYLVRGMTAKQIADTLKLSKRTIEHYLINVKAKLSCTSRFELVNQALKLKCIKDKLLG